MRAAVFLLTAVTAADCHGASPALRAAAILPAPGGLPTFRIDCRPDAAHPAPGVDMVTAVRFDGTLLEAGFAGAAEPRRLAMARLRSSASPIVALVPVGARMFSPVVRSFRVPLTPGRHTAAFRCAGSWSEDVPFYWEPAG